MNWKAMATAFAAAVGFILLLLYGLVWGNPRDVPTPMIGHPAPEFTLPTLAGDTLALKNAGDLPLVINFWASWCPPCQGEHPLLVQLNEDYKGRARLVGIVYQDTRSQALQWLKERGGDWTNVLDAGSRTAIEFGVRGVPETFFVTRDHRILMHIPGPLTPDLIQTWMPRLLAANDSIARVPGS